MISTAKKLTALAALALSAAAMTGCAPVAQEATATTTSTATEAATTSEWPTKLVFGAVPSENSTSLADSYKVLLQLLKDELGIDVEFYQATDYAGIIEAQVAGKVDLASYGPFSYVLAGFRGANLEVAGVATSGVDVEPGYQSYGLTQGDNMDINSIADFAGKTVCFVDPASTSGYLYPSAGLLEVGIDPETGVTPVFAGGHDASALAIANGDCEAGFAYDAMTQTLIDKGDLAEGDLKTVWESPVIAGAPTAVRADLPEDLKAKIKEIFTTKANHDWLVANGYCDSEENCGLTDDDSIWGFVAKDDSFYDGVRQVCELTGSSKCQ